MQYESVKRSVGRYFSGSPVMRKILYSLLDLLLLRTWHIKKALKTICQQIPGDAEILDAGCGFGQYTWRMSGMNSHWHITGVDINKDHIEDCSRFFSRAGLSDRITFRTADLVSFSEPGKYNLILSVDVMEHISDDESVFRNFFSSLADNGILLISTPSDKGGSYVHNHGDEPFIEEHVRNGYSITDITRKLSAAGFTDIETKYTYGKPGNISWHLSMRYPVKMLNRSSLFAVILPFYYMLVLPLAIILNISDLRLPHNTGTGLIVKAIRH